MSSSESDVSWQTLRRIVRGWAGGSAELAEVRHLHGGSVGETLGLVLQDGARAVLKVSAHRVDRSVVREAQQLAHLRMLGIPVPTVFGWHLADLDQPDSWLLMEWVEGVDLAKAKEQTSAEQYDALQRELARVVLSMHSQVGHAYMRVGADDEECPDWATFYERIYAPMWATLLKSDQTSKQCRKHCERVREALPRLLSHGDQPRLVHWDLWSGNVLAAPDAGGAWRVTALLDPMCKYAHAEAELAYLEFFGTVNKAFLEEYKRTLRPGDGYAQVRRPVYQMFFLLDHAAFFGGAYHEKLAAAAERVAAMV